MLTRYCLIFCILSSTLSFEALAEDAMSGQEAEITIRDGEDKTFYEHRVNGVLTEIKVVPAIGSEYYLVPADGGGWIREERSSVLVPKWVLFEW